MSRPGSRPSHHRAPLTTNMEPGRGAPDRRLLFETVATLLFVPCSCASSTVQGGLRCLKTELISGSNRTMARHATVTIDITCPACSRRTRTPSGIISFSWGMIPARYRRNRSIRWLTAPDWSRIPSFKLIDSRGRLQYNFGDWRFTDVIAFDSDPNPSEYFCGRCKQEFEAVAVRIVHGRISSGLAFLPGECVKRFGRSPRDLVVVELTPNGATIVHDEWLDPSLRLLSTSTDEPSSWFPFPSLGGEEHSVVHVDPCTGKVLDLSGYYAVPGYPCHYVFPTFADAERFVDAWQREKPFSEWVIYDASGKGVAHRFAVGDPPPMPAPVRTSTLAEIAGWIGSLFVRE